MGGDSGDNGVGVFQFAVFVRVVEEEEGTAGSGV